MSAGMTDSSNLPYEQTGEGPSAYTARFRFSGDLGVADVNELRRIMLSELGGIAIRAFALKVKVGEKAEETVLHRYCAIGNVREDVAMLIRNLKRAPNPEYRPVAIVDDDPKKQHLKIL